MRGQPELQGSQDYTEGPCRKKRKGEKRRENTDRRKDRQKEGRERGRERGREGGRAGARKQPIQSVEDETASLNILN